MTASIGDRAVGLFDSGFNCAESVLSVLSDRLGKRRRICSCAIPYVATGFGGGIGRSGSTCGALSGVVLAIGLAAKRDKASDWDKKYEVYDTVSKTLVDFEKKFGSSLCRDLTGHDLGNKEERLRYRSHRVQSKRCSKFVRWCADYGAKLIASTKAG